MGLFDNFPLSNAYSVNLDWILKKIKEVEEFVRNWAAVNEVRYAGVWDITKQYPRWALVTDGDTSWLSNKPVPVGIPLENVESWQKLADLDPRIAGIIVSLDALQKETATNIANIAANSAAIETNTAAIAANTTDIANIKKRRYIFVGDSYLQGYTPDGAVVNYATKFKEYMNIPDEDIYIWGNGGGGFTAGGQGGYTFGEALERNHSDVTSPDTITDIWIIGGYNDQTDFAKIPDGINVAKTNAAKFFPNAILRIGFVGRNCSVSNNSQAGLIRACVEYKKSNVAYLTNIEYASRSIGQFSDDGIHPKQAGQDAIAKALVDICKTGSYTPAVFITVTGTTVILSASQFGDTINLYIAGNMVDVTGLANTSLDGKTPCDLGLVTDGPFATCVYNVGVQTSGFIESTNGWVPCTVSLSVNAQRHLIAYVTCATGAGWATASSAPHIAIDSNLKTIPAMYC